MKIYLGADHGGYKLKEELKKWIKEWHHSFEDMGAFRYDSKDDYPDYAWEVGMKVGSEPKARGILLCRSGQGVCVVANKARGARAVVAWNEQSAEASRHDDDANILCLPADYLTIDNAKKIVHAFLVTKFSGDEEDKRRLEKIRKIDQNL
ncbi:MAG TPA: RpiB/LacA/LacB family sugar-phosphate isomerase [Verrucomicrobiae bacterium]|nr:RpiB/LacA/LacB family sugar-phosphate isomerase [Verrucomicrobiae bacterium]